MLLESMESDSSLSRFSYVGFDPACTLELRADRATLSAGGSAQEMALDEAFRFMLARASPLPSNVFLGGFVGYCSYELAQAFEPALKLRSRPNGAGFPLGRFAYFSKGVVFDRLRSLAYGINLGSEELARLAPFPPLGEFHAGQARSRFSDSQFASRVLRAKECIAAGDAYQVVLSNALEFSHRGDLRAFYSRLRAINPSTYMYHLRLGDEDIVGSSPEQLLRVEGRRVQAFPIAGTRPRGSTAGEDAALERDLRSDAKELAEHMMLVDLARNDVGKVCSYGSVDVPSFMGVKKYSHVMHIVSEVTGTLASDKTPLDALASIFPAGTVSGAPKVRAMQIIDELEGIQRGPYAGAVGYFSPNGVSDFAITIRTLFSKGARGYVQSGAGIVADSNPRREFLECQHKAAALLEAAQIASA